MLPAVTSAIAVAMTMIASVSDVLFVWYIMFV
jgi:hypothetical protein